MTDAYDDDPRGQHIYSPEDSDTQRFGDWQTKVACAVWGVTAAAILACASYWLI